jgi:hypothetical protein
MQIKPLNLVEDANDLAAAYPAFRAGTLEAEPGFPAPGRIRLRTRAIGRDGQFSQALAALAPDGTVLGIGLYGGSWYETWISPGSACSCPSGHDNRVLTWR